MNDIAIAALGTFAALAPFGALHSVRAYERAGVPVAGIAAVSSLVSLLVLSLGAAVAGPFLEFLDVSPENFQLAAGAVMAPFAIRLLLLGDSMPPPLDARRTPVEPYVFPIAVPLLAGPAALTAAVSYSARFGFAEACVAALVALVVSAGFLVLQGPIHRAVGSLGIGALGRLSGALLMIIAVELVVDGVRSV